MSEGRDPRYERCVHMLERVELVSRQLYLQVLGLRASVPLETDLGRLLKAVDHQALDLEILAGGFLAELRGEAMPPEADTKQIH